MNFPEGWKECRAKELFKSCSEKGHPEETLLSATQDNGVVPRESLPTRVTMPSKNLGSFKLVEEGDFVISLRSFQGGIEYSQYRGIVSPAYTVLRPRMDLSCDYYKQLFKSRWFVNQLQGSVIGIRDGKQISYRVFSSVRLPYPPLPEQKKIAEILGSVDEAIQATQATIEQTKRVKKGLLQELLTRGIGHTRFKTLGNGMTVPEGWKQSSLKTLLNNASLFTDGDWIESKDQDPTGEVRLIQLADIGDGSFLDKSSRYLTIQKARELNCTFLAEGDLLIARMPDPIGRACIFPKTGYTAVTAVDVCIIRPNSSVDPQWLKQLINSNSTRCLIEAYATGTTRQRISRKNLGAIRLLAPPLPEQKKIAEILGSVDDKIQAEHEKALELERLKIGLMQDLLSGQVRVAL
jgi:type I restriction enzyme S subunit